MIERHEVERGGHWRYVEHSDHGVHGFEGRYQEVVPPERSVRTSEWDGMPGHVIVETATLEGLGDGRTKLVSVSLFHIHHTSRRRRVTDVARSRAIVRRSRAQSGRPGVAA